MDKNKPTHLTPENLAGIEKFDDLLDLRYGKVGTPLRDEFETRVNETINSENNKNEKAGSKKNKHYKYKTIGRNI